MKAPRRLFLLGLILVLGGGFLAWRVQTAGGTVRVEDVRFMGDEGTMMSGLLYVPPNASVESPAPGILAVHGYINSRETQSGFAIEFARRGFVVLALDQTGHGYSDPPAQALGYGGPAGLEFLRSLDIVDPENIGLEGHSMGGWAVANAAAADPDGYETLVSVGSTLFPLETAAGEPFVPRNFAAIFSTWDEFSALMWGVPTGSEAGHSERMMTLFGTDRPVEPERLYGSLADGTARILYQPVTTHPGDHLSTQAIGDAVEWMQRALDGERELSPNDQIWYWKELGTLLAFVGAMLLLFPVGSWLLGLPTFREVGGDPAPARGAEGAGWWIAAALTLVVPVVTYFWLNNAGSELLSPNALLPQSVTNGILFWAVVNGLVTAVLFGLWHVTRNREEGSAAGYGLAWDDGSTGVRIGKSLLVAAGVVGTVHLLLSLSDFFFQIDFRFWVVALKPMSLLHFGIFLRYVLPFTLFFVVLGVALHGQLRREGDRPGPTMVRNAALLSGGFVVLLLIQYVPLLGGQPLPLGEPLLTIVAYQFVPLLALVGLISTWFYRKTGTIWTGAFVNGLFVTWYIVAGQATHVAL